jgi:hypothetical protein
LYIFSARSTEKNFSPAQPNRRAKRKGVLGEEIFCPRANRVFLPAACGGGQIIGPGFASLTGGLN